MAAGVAAAMSVSSCNDYLDASPDSRITVDTEEKVKALLVTAYPSASYVRVTELASDNADDLNGDLNGYYDRFRSSASAGRRLPRATTRAPQ